MVSPLQSAIDFLKSFGFFDIILPFVLVFTLLFAIFEKTEVLGKDKKNLSAMISFAIAFFVVGATNIIPVLKEALPMISLGLVIIISFILLYGSLHTGKEEFKLSKGYRGLIGVLAFVAVILIFVGSIRDDSGNSWLVVAWDFIVNDVASGPVVSTVIFLGLTILVVWLVGWGPGTKKE